MLNRRQFIAALATAAASTAAMSALPFTNVLRSSRAQENILDTVVIGGGVSGLTAAYQLRDMNILLLEAQDHFGGRTITGKKDGWHYTKGTEYLGTPDGTFAEIIRDLKLNLLEIPSPMDQLWRDGKFYAGSSGRLRLLIDNGGLPAFNRFLGALKKVAASYEEIPSFDPAGELARLDNMTCLEWFDELRLPEVYAEMYNVTFRGLFGANIEEVSALGAFAEVAFDFEGADHPVHKDDVEEMIRSAKRETSGAYSFRTGITEVIDALSGALAGKAQASSKVTAVTYEDETYTVEYEHNGAAMSVDANSVIFAAPMPITLNIGTTVLTPQQTQILHQVPYAEFVTAAIFSDEPIYTDAFDLALPDGWFVTDVYDSTWMQKHMGEQYEGYVASMYIGSQSYKDTGLVDMSDEETLERAYQDVQAIWPDIRERVTGHDIHRFKHGYPVMTTGAYTRLTKLYHLLDGGVQLAGDGIVYPTFEAALETGAVAAERIRDWLT